jgi:hypothetical protein
MPSGKIRDAQVKARQIAGHDLLAAGLIKSALRFDEPLSLTQHQFHESAVQARHAQGSFAFALERFES